LRPDTFSGRKINPLTNHNILMKSQITTILIALVVGYIGGNAGNISGLFFDADTSSRKIIAATDNADLSNPFQTQSVDSDLALQLETVQQKISELEFQLNELTSNTLSDNDTEKAEDNEQKGIRLSRPVTPSKENLVAAGINPDIADDVLRRISQQEFRRLQLQNLMQRADASSRRQYSQELRELNRNKISLRTELGDDSYDQYLFVSGQNNRVKVSSVMAGSPAESSGFQQDDVILFYDNQKILNWSDIRKATVQGEIGHYTSVEILRNGQQMSLMVPRGTLGVQLDATQLDPAQ